MRTLAHCRLQVAILAGTTALLFVSRAFPQEPTKPGLLPFAPAGMADPERAFEQFFSSSTPANQQTLDALEIPMQEERDYGAALVDAYMAEIKRQKMRVIRKGTDVDYLVKLVATIRPMMANAERYPKITVCMIDSAEIEARSFPGGTLFFSKGLLSLAPSEAALVGVVGHELSHLDRGHQLLPLKRTRLLQGASFDPQSLMSGIRLFSRPFRPEDEVVADKDGATWAYRAGYDSREFARLLARMHERSQEPKLPFTAFFQTHPYFDDRSESILQLFDSLQQTDPRDRLYIGKRNLALRVPKSTHLFDE